MSLEIVYCQKLSNEMKERDVGLVKLRQTWEKAMNAQVVILEIDGRLIVKPIECPISLRLPSYTSLITR